MPSKTCDFCGENSYMLFPCKGCGGSFCAVHRLPAKHGCLGGNASSGGIVPVEQSTVSSSNVQPVYQDNGPREYYWEPNITEFDGDPFDPSSGVILKGVFLPRLNETLHLIIAFFIMFFIGVLTANSIFSNLSLGFLTYFGGSYTDFERFLFPFVLAILSTGGFLTHEFAHRQVGRHFLLPARFRLLTVGMALTMVGIVAYLFSGGTVPPFAIPGAVVVIGLDNRDHAGKCKIAGPLSNFIISCVLLPLIFVFPASEIEYCILVIYGAYINTFLGVFNMLPVAILDGRMILQWNKKYWVLLMLGLVALLVIELSFLMNFGIVISLKGLQLS